MAHRQRAALPAPQRRTPSAVRPAWRSQLDRPDHAPLRTGCSGWGYEEWRGGFYPAGLEAGSFLPEYARAFDTVEIDSSFYRAPGAQQCEGWYRNTPPGFLFTVKAPQSVTHERRLRDAEAPLREFYSGIAALREKCGPVCVQLPPGLRYEKDHGALEEFIGLLDPRFDHAVEFRHPSWFRDDVLTLLRDRNICSVWGTNQYLDTPQEQTADFLYVRMIGDRSLTQFGSIQRDKAEEMQAWQEAISRVRAALPVRFVFFNNHYAGFGPASVNEFRRIAGMPPAEFPLRNAGQRSLDLF